MLADAGVFDAVEIAVPGDAARAAQLLAVREAVPAAVNRRVGRAKMTIDPRIDKTAADMIVPVRQAGRAAGLLRRASSRGAVWTRPSGATSRTATCIPTSSRATSRMSIAGKEAILEFGREVLRLGGAPLAEHGVGRNPIKQELLRMMYGDEGDRGDAPDQARRSIPEWKLSPGVLFAAIGSGRAADRARVQAWVDPYVGCCRRSQRRPSVNSASGL